MGQWLKESVLAWVLSSLMIGLAFTLITTVPFKSTSEKILGPFAGGAVAAAFSVVPTVAFAVLVYAPLRPLLLGTPKWVALSLGVAGLVIFVWAAIRLPHMTGDSGWTGAFCLWLGAAIASFSAVNALHAGASA